MRVDFNISEKEASILKGTVELLKTGKNPYSIKVSDIAAAAGVGKGTIYEYFQSKEEVLEKSILYSMQQEAANLESSLRSYKGFSERLGVLCDYFIQSIQSEKSVFNMIISSDGAMEMYPYGFAGKDGCDRMFGKINQIIDLVLEPGKKEGKVASDNTDFYNRMVIKNIFADIGHYMFMTRHYPDITSEDVKKDTLKMALKALG